MSTGLTWVTVGDNAGAAPDLQQSPVVFNDYNEAYNYCDWYLRIANAGIVYGATMMIYTTSPNQSGYFVLSGGVITFTPFD